MPNVGKPSKGCKVCRDRRLKCDGKRPSCGQCMRINKECYGYRDPLNLMFKNENAVVVRRANRRYQEIAKGKATVRHWNSSEALDSDATTPGSSCASSVASFQHNTGSSSSSMYGENITWELMPRLEDQAIAFFLARYVQTPGLVPRGQFEYLPQIIGQEGTEKILQTSVTAAGLACLGNATKCEFVSKRARQEYVAALAMTNKALSKPETAREDSTLISVLLLGLYENFTFRTKDSQHAWTRHINGATALLNLRGPEQLSDNLRRKVFSQVFGAILLTCLQNRSEVPQSIMDLWESGLSVHDYSYNTTGRSWTVTMIRFINNVINLSKDSTSLPSSMVATVLTLDHDLDALNSQIPSIWKPETMDLEDSTAYVFGTFYHVYSDPWIIQMWNNLRAVRMNLHTILREQLLKSLAQDSPSSDRRAREAQIAASEEAMRTTALTICASVPQLTGQIPFPNSPDASSVHPDLRCSDLYEPDDPRFQLHPPGTFITASQSTGLSFLSWPLYFAGKLEIASPSLRSWVIDRLFYIGLQIGSMQAVVFAEELKAMKRQGSGFEFRKDKQPGDGVDI